MNKEEDNKKYNYECKRCEYKTLYLSDMKKHLYRKKKCDVKKELGFINEDEYDVLSLIKIENNTNNNVIIKKKENHQNNIEENKNQNNTNDENKNDIEKKQSNPKCEFCEKNFFNKQALDRHLIICKKTPSYLNQQLLLLSNKNNTNNENKESIKQTTIQNIQNNTINNIQNNNYVNNLVLNINNESININKLDDKIIPFFDKFDTSHINDEIQLNLLTSSLFIDTLQEILKNSVNLNFLINLESKTGKIYKNENENIITVDNIVIYNNIWKKVYEYLLELLDKIKIRIPKFDDDALLVIKNKINKKYVEFIKGHDKDYNDKVIGTINQVSSEYKPRVEKIFEHMTNKQIKN